MDLDSEQEHARVFAKALKVLRVVRGLTQKELADRSGVAAAQISKYETAVCLPRHPTLHRLLVGLDLPFEALGDASKFIQTVESRDRSTSIYTRIYSSFDT
jgi:transcriptional regulator with XRE-family HTH domain